MTLDGYGGFALIWGQVAKGGNMGAGAWGLWAQLKTANETTKMRQLQEAQIAAEYTQQAMEAYRKAEEDYRKRLVEYWYWRGYHDGVRAKEEGG